MWWETVEQRLEITVPGARPGLQMRTQTMLGSGSLTHIRATKTSNNDLLYP